MMTSSNGTFSALLTICAGDSPVNGEFPAQRPVTGSFDVFFDLRLNERLSKQSWDRWFETPSRSLWRHSNGDGLGCKYICKACLLTQNTSAVVNEIYHVAYRLSLLTSIHIYSIQFHGDVNHGVRNIILKSIYIWIASVCVMDWYFCEAFYYLGTPTLNDR